MLESCYKYKKYLYFLFSLSFCFNKQRNSSEKYIRFFSKIFYKILGHERGYGKIKMSYLFLLAYRNVLGILLFNKVEEFVIISTKKSTKYEKCRPVWKTYNNHNIPLPPCIRTCMCRFNFNPQHQQHNM